MRRSALAAAGVLSLVPLLVLAACPSLSEIGVGGPPDATVDQRSDHAPSDGGSDGHADTTPRDAAVVPCTADVAADPANCGRCNHDCLGGACYMGACQAVVLYAANDTPSSIVVDGPTLVVTV